MATYNLNFKLEHSLLTSVLLHGGLLLLAIVGVQHHPTLPQGTDLAYIELGETAASVASPAKTMTPVSESVFEKSAETTVAETNEVVKTETSVGISGQGTQSGATQGREGVENGGEVSPETRYLFELKKLLERKKVYPQMAKAMGYSGTVRVEFTLGREGEIQSLRVLKGTHPVLDEAAQKLVRSIEKLKPFPEEIAKSQWTIEVPIEYSLR